MEAELITMKELRVMLANRAESSIRRDIELGDLPPPIQLGNKNYFSPKQVREYLKKVQAKRQK